MKYKNFLLRAVNLLLILGVLWQYQQVALVRAAAVSQRKQEIAEVEAYNASVLQAQSAAQAEQSQSGYRDGTYEGSVSLLAKTILNALRYALGIFSGKAIYNFGTPERLRTLRRSIFTVKASAPAGLSCCAG